MLASSSVFCTPELEVATTQGGYRLATSIDGSVRLYLPRQALWLCDFEAEFFAVPNAPHDDQADAVVQAMAYAVKRPFLLNAKSVKNYGRLIEAMAY
jgi:hypothetical protein